MKCIGQWNSKSIIYVAPHVSYLAWYRCDSQAISAGKKARCGSVRCVQNDSLGKVILDIHRTGNFIRAKLQYRQLSAPDLSAPDKLFRLRGRQYAAVNPSVRLVDDKFVRFPGISFKSSKSASIKDRLARKSSKSHCVRKKPVDGLFTETRCTITTCRYHVCNKHRD